MRKFGLIGYPLGHSFSKNYFTEKFINEHIHDCNYENFPLQSIEKLPELISEVHELNGLNVTIPYKSEVFRFLHIIDPEAREIGAVNVVKITRLDGRIILSGYNSDITGISDSLSHHIKDNIKNAIVLGTGGSSRAVCYVLEKFGLKVTLVSRNKRPGIICYSDLTMEIINDTHLIVNTTPLGMYPNIESKPEINYKLLNKSHILFDLIYNPEITAFLRLGKERGCTIIGGLRMLHSQAERSWEIWNDANF